uniref:Uncharacterized protein n=1 Tax=Tanacetum cinerariifolium TaxID=118510 RepID=A0A699IJ80_TANCI|nr:hypothetical protein [Tanacetum cinerariifolium]
MDDVPVLEPNQHDDVPVEHEPVLVDEDEDPKEDEFKEEEDPQEEEDDMEVDIEKDENEPELTYPYEEMDPLNPPSPASDMEKGTVAMEKMDEKLGNAEGDVECKKLKKELEEARIIPPKSTPMTQATIRRMIKDNVDAAIAAKRARHANVGNDARASGPVKGYDATPAAHCEPNALDRNKATDDCRVLSNRRSSTNGARIVELKGKDCAQNVKNQSTVGQYQHKIRSPQQKPDHRAIF